MKKYLLGLFAIVLAISLSAFTAVPERKSVTDPFWYKINPLDSKVTQVLGQRTQQSAQDASGCQNQTSTQCVRGYNTDPGYSVGDVAATGNHTIMKSNP
ncbi:hypothetical protein [Terrimonas alba]|uniref:hypothetical protein n=1 Tax=Terrimonas alba TaxID=3349636 RepID=UPI0035F36AF2